MVMNHTTEYVDETELTINHVGRIRQTFFENGRHRHNLERRTGLIGVTDRLVNSCVWVGLGVLVRIERWIVGHREDLTRMWIHHDNRDSLCARLLGGRENLLLHHIL